MWGQELCSKKQAGTKYVATDIHEITVTQEKGQGQLIGWLIYMQISFFFFFFGKRKSAYCLYQLDALFFPLFNIYYSFYINDWRPYHLMKLAIWNIGRNIHHSISAMIAVLYDQEVLGKNMLDVIYTFPFPYFCIFTLIFLYLYFLILNYIVLFNIPLKR